MCQQDRSLSHNAQGYQECTAARWREAVASVQVQMVRAMPAMAPITCRFNMRIIRPMFEAEHQQNPLCLIYLKETDKKDLRSGHYA